MTWPLRTEWRIVGVPDHERGLDVRLVVDTTAADVVEAIEQAAANNGITLELVAPPEEDA